jgi:hypothetical protein
VIVDIVLDRRINLLLYGISWASLAMNIQDGDIFSCACNVAVILIAPAIILSGRA